MMLIYSSKNVFQLIANESDFCIADKDYIHLLVSHPPNIAVSSIVKKKTETNQHQLIMESVS